MYFMGGVSILQASVEAGAYLTLCKQAYNMYADNNNILVVVVECA